MLENTSIQNRFCFRFQLSSNCVIDLNKCIDDNYIFRGTRARNKITVELTNLMKGKFFG